MKDFISFLLMYILSVIVEAPLTKIKSISFFSFHADSITIILPELHIPISNKYSYGGVDARGQAHSAHCLQNFLSMQFPAIKLSSSGSIRGSGGTSIRSAGLNLSIFFSSSLFSFFKSEIC